MVPDTLSCLGPIDVDLVILGNCSEVLIVFNKHICWNLVQLSLDRMLLDFLPVVFAVPLDRLDAKLPRPVDSCLLLHTVGTHSVVLLDHLEVTLRAELLQSAHPARVLEPECILDMHRTFLPLLQLPNDILGSASRVPFTEEFRWIDLGIVECAQPCPIHFISNN